MKELYLIPAVLNLFDGAPNTNATTDSQLSAEMRTYYSDYLIDLAEPKLVHDQFGQKHPIPKNGGKTINFRKYSPLPKITSPLAEGVTPDGQKIAVSDIEASIEQYGGYVTLSDILLLTAVDNNLVEATKLCASQAGRSLDTISREELVGGTNVQYGDESVNARHLLTGGESEGNDYLTVDCIKRAVRALKHMNAEKINGDFVCIINPDCSYDLTNDPEWKYPHQYVDTAEMYSGEIGKIGGYRFVETTEAKIFRGADLAKNARTLSASAASTSTNISFDGGSVDANALVGRYIIVGDQKRKVISNTTTSITVDSAVSVKDNDVIYPGEGGAKGRAVYATLVIADNAYGVTEVSGGGLEMIIKQLGSAGTGDPLNQRATAGWKATKVTKRLVEEYMVRIETCSTYDAEAN